MDTIELGRVEVTRVLDFFGRAAGADEFFPEIPAQDWQRPDLQPDFYEPGTHGFLAAVQTFVLRSAGRTILVDTGVGNDKPRPGAPWDRLRTGYLDELAAAGVRPDDVDLVINTHLHTDHVGWNTRLDGDEWVPTFPNATYLLPRADVEFWDPGGEHRPKRPTAHFTDSVAPVREAGLVELWEGERVIDENLRLETAAGHTPGSSVLHLVSGGDRAVFLGDLLHTPLQLGAPHHNCAPDEDPAAARASRWRMLERAAEARALVVPAHFGGHGAVEVRRAGAGFDVVGWAGFSRRERSDR